MRDVWQSDDSPEECKMRKPVTTDHGAVMVKLSVREYVPGGSVVQPRFVRNETVDEIPVVAPAVPLPVFEMTVPPLVLSAVPAVPKPFSDHNTVDAGFVGAGDALPA